jgi:hypothetical protein
VGRIARVLLRMPRRRARKKYASDKAEAREQGVLAFVDETGRIWAYCAQATQSETEYVIEGPSSGFVYDQGMFRKKAHAFHGWLADHLLNDGLFYVKDKETAQELAQPIAENAQRILRDREGMKGDCQTPALMAYDFGSQRSRISVAP